MQACLPSAGITLQGGKSLDRGLGEKSAASHPRGFTAEAVKGATSLTWEQPPFPLCFWASGEGQPAPKTSSLHSGNSRSPEERWKISFSAAKTVHKWLPMWETWEENRVCWKKNQSKLNQWVRSCHKLLRVSIPRLPQRSDSLLLAAVVGSKSHHWAMINQLRAQD